MFLKDKVAQWESESEVEFTEESKVINFDQFIFSAYGAKLLYGKTVSIDAKGDIYDNGTKIYTYVEWNVTDFLDQKLTGFCQRLNTTGTL